MCLWPVVNSLTPQPIFLEVTRVFSDTRHDSSLATGSWEGCALLTCTPHAAPCMTQHWTTTLQGQESVTPELCVTNRPHQVTPRVYWKAVPPAMLRAASSPPSHCRNSHHSNDRGTPHLTLVTPIPPGPNAWQPLVQLSVSMDLPLLDDAAR